MCRQGVSRVVTPPPFNLPSTPFTRARPSIPAFAQNLGLAKSRVLGMFSPMPNPTENANPPAYTADDIRKAMVTLARVIRLHGDAPWPLMERLQRELDALESREALLADLLGEEPKDANPASFG